ncbi:2050_t:CDS:1, partial [Dentiscutata heterogama]
MHIYLPQTLNNFADEFIGLERFLKLSGLLVSLSSGQFGNSVDNVGIIASADWNAFNM